MDSRTRLKIESTPIRLIIIALFIIIIGISTTHSMALKRMSRRSKRGFASLGCLGVYDRAKFASLSHICDECYQLYRDQELHKSCRQDCFQNDVFGGCIDALLLSHEHKKLEEMVNHLNGKK